MTTVETRVVDNVPSHSSVNAGDASETEMVDTALKQEEYEKTLEDEEIDSCEGVDLEEEMINVAIANSVVDAGSQPATGNGSQQSARYGLRKRQRPGDVHQGAGSSVEAESKPPDNICSSAAPKAVIANGRLNLVSSETGNVDTRNEQSEEAVPQVNIESSQGGTRRIPSRSEAPLGEDDGRGRRRPVQQLIAPHFPREPELPMQSLAHPAAAQRAQSKPAATRTRKTSPTRKARRQSSNAKTSKSFAPAPQPAPAGAQANTSNAVPNPLSQSTPPHSSRPIGSSMKSDPIVPDAASASSVPCPLAQPTVPCPLPSQSTPGVQQDKRVTIAEPPVPRTRNRVFSVDLDPSTFDFMSSDHNDIGKSDDDIGDLTGATPPEDLSVFKRDRAFSFEFFTFAGDDLLPAPAAAPAARLPETPLPEESVSSRPRGDSLIFDPVSFQDGGIHEENAIIKVNAAKNIDAPSPTLLADSRLAAAPPAAIKLHAMPVGGPQVAASIPSTESGSNHGVEHPAAPSSENGQIATLPSALAGVDANGNGAGTFQLNLLNKDGRIGIYLPEARRARIARFHAKRKMRIWRKRIKYDCRKKLADSRPRIKGRFVKRSDMDE